MKSLYPLVKQNVNQLFLFILIFCVFQSRKTWSQTSPKTFNPIYAISSSGGIQTFTVPTGVTSITITAKGAAGGNGKSTGGKGATVKATFSVASGAVLNIVVGAQGASRDDRYGGGGGGSFVSVGAFNTTNLLVAAGGGGGNGDQPGGNASTEPGSGEGGNYGNGMTGGGGGGGGINGTGGDAGYDFQGGGGGSGAPEGFEGGKSGISGTFGGYGGGGGSGYGGGGGGGYTGGNGGNESESGGGGGGGSYTKSGATAKTISIDNTGGGQVIIEWISALPSFAFSSSVQPSTCGGSDGALLFTTDLPANSYQLFYKKNGSEQSAMITVGSSNTRVAAGGGTFSLTGLGAGTYSAFKITHNGNDITLAGPYDLSDPVKPTFLVGTKVSPSTCNSTNGSIQLTGLSLSTSYGVSYQKDGGAAVTQTLVSDASGNLVIGSLGSGNYSNIKVTLKNCVSESATAVVSAPTFSMSQLSSVNPSTCGGVDGSILFSTTLPTGSYTLSYEKNGQSSSGSITVGTPSGRVGGMSATFTLSGLGAGIYGKFKILYEGCEVTLAGPYDLSDPVKPTFLVGTKVSPSTCNSTNGSIQLTGLSLSTSYGVSYQKDGGA
ncbi:hypothetical protein FHS57_006277, partial [Runella defluvii]|nr:hypothetical protein [Runella defluvii]